MTSTRRVLGLLGGIASGKSHVAAIAASLAGGEVLDADALATRALDAAAADGRLEERLGKGVVDAHGAPLREAIARLAFEDDEALARLEGLLHPPVLEAIEARLAAHAAGEGPGLLVLDVPLLVERGLDRRCDVLWFVRASHATRMDRAAARGLTEEDVLRRERRQETLAEKQRTADLVIENDGDPTPQIVEGLRALGFVVTAP